MVEKVLELRVHGVSNTPPAAVLGLAPDADPSKPENGPWPVLKAGDATTGFYRSSQVHPAAPSVIEAYSWGQLTSGARVAKDIRRALWTLLLPFAVANVGFFARPDVPADADEEKPSTGPGVLAFLVRLFCLSLTLTLVVGAVGVGDDLVAWQCADKECLARIPGAWEFLTKSWWSVAGRPLVVGMLVPFAVLALIGLLSWRSSMYEAELAEVDPGNQPPAALTNPLQQRTFWCGEGQLRRLAVLHLATGVAVAALIPVVSMLLMAPPQGARKLFAAVVVIGLSATIVAGGVALATPYVTRRGGHTPLGRIGAVVIAVASASVVAAIVYLLLPHSPEVARALAGRPITRCLPVFDGNCVSDRSLVGYDEAIAGLGTGQVLLLLAIAGVSRSGRRALMAPVVTTVLLIVGHGWGTGWLPWVGTAPQWLHQPWLPGLAIVATAAATLFWSPTQAVVQPGFLSAHARIGWGGCGPAVLCGVGWMLGLAYTAGVLFWTANLLNGGATATGRSTLTLPDPIVWGGAVFAVWLLVFVVIAGLAAGRYVRLRRESIGDILRPGRDYSPHDRRRAWDVANFYGLHRLDGEHALPIIGRFATVSVVLVLAGTAGALAHTRPTETFASKAMADIGGTLAGFLPILIAGLGALIYRSVSVRRAVGVVWDLATFWPRAGHPLGPPCYAERAVPQLQTRTDALLRLPAHHDDHVKGVILSGHSQGAIISVAAILQMPADWARRVWLLTYGCQLTRLYGRIFPAYFGPTRLTALNHALTVPGAAIPSWTNFWRETDPLGWPVDVCLTQLEVKDPADLHPSGGEVNDPPIRNHSGYPSAAEYQAECTTRVRELLRRLG
ncbi:MAG: hypothetical protein ACM30G_01695 [Micromonosporaceae bacterium]